MLKTKDPTHAVANLDTRDDDFEIINGHRVLREGRSYRAGLTFMDAQTIRDGGAHRMRPVTRVVAADGDPLSMHRPGWRVAATHDADPPEFTASLLPTGKRSLTPGSSTKMS
jgi:hypothetical protein